MIEVIIAVAVMALSAYVVSVAMGDSQKFKASQDDLSKLDALRSYATTAMSCENTMGKDGVRDICFADGEHIINSYRSDDSRLSSSAGSTKYGKYYLRSACNKSGVYFQAKQDQQEAEWQDLGRGIPVFCPTTDCNFDETFDSASSLAFWDVTPVGCKNYSFDSFGKALHVGGCGDNSGIVLSIPQKKCTLKKGAHVHIEMIVRNYNWGDDSPLIGPWIGPSWQTGRVTAVGPGSDWSSHNWALGGLYVNGPVYASGPAGMQGTFKYILDASPGLMTFKGINTITGQVYASMSTTALADPVLDGDTIGLVCHETACDISKVLVNVTY